MDIIYKQVPSDGVFDTLGIQNCYLKHLCARSDSKYTSRKIHHHTGFEIHFMNKGHQKYIINGKEYDVFDKHILLIPPLTKHCTVVTCSYTSKITLTFNKCAQSPFECINDVIFCKADDRTLNSINNILNECKTSSVFSKQIISHCIYEILVMLLRTGGFEEQRTVIKTACEDDRLIIAKRYIKDNIEFNFTVSDVAAHCCLGTKQLTRLFKNHENITPFVYIQKQKIMHIDSLLQGGYALKDISEKMNFSSEYYFNYFYKKYAGISPGVYKKMHIR